MKVLGHIFLQKKIVKIFHDFWILNSREKLTARVK